MSVTQLFIFLAVAIHLFGGKTLQAQTFEDIDDWVDLAAFLTTAILASNLSARARRSAYEAIARQKELEVSNRRLEEEHRRAEVLLLNILPGEIAEELESKGLVSPRYFEDVTVMFTDFVGFTTSAEKLAAEELVALLHEYFTAFDEITKRHGLEKMKTVGDSYMCIGGLPKRTVRRRSIGGGIAASIVIAGWIVFFFVFPNVLQRIGSILTVMGAFYIFIQLRMRASRAIPDVATE